jgi:hypothetical protein
MSNGNNSGVFKAFFDSLLDECIRFDVDVSGGFINKYQFASTKDSTSNADELLLTNR